MRSRWGRPFRSPGLTNMSLQLAVRMLSKPLPYQSLKSYSGFLKYAQETFSLELASKEDLDKIAALVGVVREGTR